MLYVITDDTYCCDPGPVTCIMTGTSTVGLEGLLKGWSQKNLQHSLIVCTPKPKTLSASPPASNAVLRVVIAHRLDVEPMAFHVLRAQIPVLFQV